MGSLKMRLQGLTFQTLVKKGVVTEKNCHLIADEVSEHFTVQLTRYFAVHDIRRFEMNTPASWWQHFKRDCMPSWFKRLFPVKYDQKKFDISAIYRSLPVDRYEPIVIVEEEV